MSDTPTLNRDNLPSSGSLIKATVGSAVVAGALFVTAVLPAEFGIDPTGLGQAMGLDKLNQSKGETSQSVLEQAQAEPLETQVSTLLKAANSPRSDTVKIALMPGQGAEIKSRMNPGDSFVFNWTVEGGTVSFDMHGERPNANGAFTSYWLGDNQHEASGTFSAPFTGTHGWYWENKGDAPVTVVLKTHGFYADLYMP